MWFPLLLPKLISLPLCSYRLCFHSVAPITVPSAKSHSYSIYFLHATPVLLINFECKVQVQFIFLFQNAFKKRIQAATVKAHGGSPLT